MKSVLLYANQDSGLEARLQAALDMVRLFGGHLTCLQVTPYEAFIMGDPFGGVYALSSVAKQIAEEDDKHRSTLEERLADEGVSWDWHHVDGGPAQMIVECSRLSDVIVLSLAPNDDGQLPITPDVAVHARAPVLAMPTASRGFDSRGPALVAWNGSHEAAHALRFALPVLAKASRVHVVTVTEDLTGFPAIEAAEYLARHDVVCELQEWQREDRSIADSIIAATQALGATYVTMGAYGHSRMREAVLGGVTRDLLRISPVPLLLGH